MFQVSNRTNLSTVETYSTKTDMVKQSLSGLIHSLPIKMKAGLTTSDIRLALRDKSVRQWLKRGDAPCKPTVVTTEHAKAAKLYLHGTVISEIDKERGMCMIM